MVLHGGSADDLLIQSIFLYFFQQFLLTWYFSMPRRSMEASNFRESCVHVYNSDDDNDVYGGGFSSGRSRGRGRGGCGRGRGYSSGGGDDEECGEESGGSRGRGRGRGRGRRRG